MERKEISSFSPRARKLISRAVIAGVEITRIKSEVQTAIGVAQDKGSERVTRGELAGLAELFEMKMNARRTAKFMEGNPLVPLEPWEDVRF